MTFNYFFGMLFPESNKDQNETNIFDLLNQTDEDGDFGISVLANDSKKYKKKSSTKNAFKNLFNFFNKDLNKKLAGGDSNDGSSGEEEEIRVGSSPV